MFPKPFSKIKFFSALILTTIGLGHGVFAQKSSSDGYKRYRITAYKAGNAALQSLSNIAEATPKPTLYVPSAFTPNGDGINDYFGVKADGIKQFSLQVFNRWGAMVFQTNDITDLWDGSYEGMPIKNTDVFVYKVKAIGKNGYPLPDENGTVTLVAGGDAE